MSEDREAFFQELNQLVKKYADKKLNEVKQENAFSKPVKWAKTLLNRLVKIIFGFLAFGVGLALCGMLISRLIPEVGSWLQLFAFVGFLMLLGKALK